jgi:hypothetical protein
MNENPICEILSMNTACLHIKPFTINGHTVVEQNIDLTPWAGTTFRLFAESDGSLSTNQHMDHYWALLECALPELVPTITLDGDGNPVVSMLPLDLTNVNFRLFDLP